MSGLTEFYQYIPEPKQQQAIDILIRKDKKYYMFYGGSRSGKTYGIIQFIRSRAIKYPGSTHLICRYSFANAKKTIWLHTMLPIFRQDKRIGLCNITLDQGIVEYKNGSLIVLGGLEPSRIDSVLAVQYGTVFITEANENKYEHIQPLFSRLNDVSEDQEGNRIVPKFICDLNPTVKTHWTNVLFRTGVDPMSGKPKDDFDQYVYMHFRPEDNEKHLSDGYIDTLKNMSPAMRRRFYEGEFGEFEGLVISIDETVHVVDDFKIPDEWERGAAIDFGFTNPFAVLYGAFDKSNETLYIYREYKKTKTTVNVHAEYIKKMEDGEKIQWRVSDHDAEDRATLHEKGILTIPAEKDVLSGLDKMIDLFRNDDTKRTNVKIFRSCVELITELYGYRWKESEMRSSSKKDRDVVKEDDHLCDCLRYMCKKVFPDKASFPGVIFGRNEWQSIQSKVKK